MNMNDYTLSNFVEESREVIKRHSTPAICVEKIVPLMRHLLLGDQSFLKPEHYRSDPDQYARNVIYIDPRQHMSLYALVWEPDQWTPIHDHGTWGVVGVLEGALEERNFLRADDQVGPVEQDIDLVPGGITMLSPSSVTSFVPSPDHIHFTGNPSHSERAVSLHLYGNEMSGFYIYDRKAHSRKWIVVSHNES
jgi:predicted metal-dependent enzyme (double-stranded beta helix superfamily)